MKCVKILKTGEVVRVTDENAAKLVKDGKCVYCPKHEWKTQKNNSNPVKQKRRTKK